MSAKLHELANVDTTARAYTENHHNYEWALFLATHCLFVGIAMFPFLSGQSLFGGIEISHSYPFFGQATFHNLLSGQLFMNRDNMNGFPSFIPVGYALNPFAWSFNAIFGNPFDALHWFVFTNAVTGGLFCAIWLRQLRLSVAASLIGSWSYIGGSWWLVITPEWSSSLPVIPLIAITMNHTVRYPFKSMIYGTLLVAYSWLALPTQEILMIFTGWGVAAITMTFYLRKHEPLHPL